jgi:hypothetical protein
MLLAGRGIGRSAASSRGRAAGQHAAPLVPAALGAAGARASAVVPLGIAPAAHAPFHPLRSARPSRHPVVVTRAVAAEASSKPAGCSRGSHWAVHKFGGTCMASAERLRAVAELMVKDSADSKLVVVSAMGGVPASPIKVTDLLLNMIKRAAKQDAAFLVDLAALQEKHVVTAKALLGETPELTEFISRLMDDIGNLKAMLQAMSIGEARGARAPVYARPCVRPGL